VSGDGVGPTARRAAAVARALASLLVVALLGLTLCALAEAQRPGARRVAGTVFSAADSTPIAGAYVAVLGTALHTTTDAAGRFLFPRAPGGALRVRLAAIGFEPATLGVAADGRDAELTAVLQPAAVVVAPVVVTASRTDQLAEDAPTSVAVATEADIARRTTIGVDEAVARMPGVQILDGQINIRGSSGYTKGLGSRVLLLVDGVPANQGDRGGINWDLLPVMEVERIEVLKGTGSALYGSAALGGVVNVITREIPERPQMRARLLAGGYADPAPPEWSWRSSPALFGGADLALSSGFGPLRALVSGGVLGNQGYRENNSDRRAHGLAKLVYEPRPELRAELYASAVHEDYGNVVFWCVQGQCDDHGLTYQPFRVDSTTLGDRLRSDKYLAQATLLRVLGPTLALKGRASWFRTAFRDRFRADSQGARADRLGAELGAEWHPTERGVVNAGAEASRSTVTSDLFGDHSQTELAGYAEHVAALGGAARVTLGARVDAIGVDGADWTALASPRLAVTWQLPVARARASIGRGFRAPSLAERFTSTVAQGIRVIPNPELHNETSWSGEVGATTRASRLLVVDAALFWSEYRDLIEPGLVSGGTEIQFLNLTRARVRGLDASAQAAGLAGGRLTATLAYTYLDARDLSLDRPLPFRPRHLATLSADWLVDSTRAGAFTAGFDARTSSRAERVDIFESDRRVAARTVDLRAAWRRGGIELLAKVENVFNYIYTLVPRTLEPPRTFSLALTLTR
jgi:outer membrane receptor for ferrienterochelin and colicins